MTSVCSCINRNGSSRNPTIRVMSWDFQCPIVWRDVPPFEPWEAWSRCHRVFGGNLRLLEVDLLLAGPSPRWGSAHALSSPCQVAMETDLEILQLFGYLGGICSSLDAVTSTIQERERLPSPFCIIERVSFSNRGVKTQEKLKRKDIFFSSNNTVGFFSDYKSNLYSE